MIGLCFRGSDCSLNR